MPRKKKLNVAVSPVLDEEVVILVEATTIQEKEPEKTAQEALGTILTQSPTPTTPQLYTTAYWAGKRLIYKCTKCKSQRNDEDSIILHVVRHYPAQEQETILNSLILSKGVAG